jgi:hypothetical protein
LGGQREQLTRHGGGADTARHEALATERRHRAEMPDSRPSPEGLLRLDWLNEQRRVAQERAAQQQEEYEEQVRRDHHHEPVAGLSEGLDHDAGYGHDL